MTILHFSDTIKDSPQIQHRDTTTDRLRVQYLGLQRALEDEEDPQKKPEETLFIGSTCGNSYETVAQAIAYLQQENFGDSQVVLVNNADRAKHANTRNAGASDCLVAQVKIHGKVHFLVGVDDSAFTFIQPYLVPGSCIKKITGVHYSDTKKELNINIPNTSAGTQFRSLKYFPVIQLIIIKLLKVHGNTPGFWEELDGAFDFGEDFSPLQEEIDNTRNQVLALLGRDTNDCAGYNGIIADYIAEVGGQLKQIIAQGGDTQDENYVKTWLPGCEGIERVQILGVLDDLRRDFGIEPVLDHGVAPDAVERFNLERVKLEDNQLSVLDQDKFGNLIVFAKDGINTIYEFAQANGFNFGDKIRITGGGIDLEIYLTESITDKTGLACLWESSSRGPVDKKSKTSGVRFFNINNSFGVGADGTDVRELKEVQGLPIGTVLTVTAS